MKPEKIHEGRVYQRRGANQLWTGEYRAWTVRRKVERIESGQVWFREYKLMETGEWTTASPARKLSLKKFAGWAIKDISE